MSHRFSELNRAAREYPPRREHDDLLRRIRRLVRARDRLRQNRGAAAEMGDR